MNPNPDQSGLTPFKPGQSGNPSGKPKGARNLSTILRDMLNEEIEVVTDGKKEKKTLGDALVRKLINNGLKGNGVSSSRAIQEIFDRIEGKARQEISVDMSEKQVIKIGGQDIEFT